jgi:alpha-N-arabinofuranosidase
LQAIYHPLRLYAEHVQDVALDVHVEGETYALKPDQESPSGRVHHVADLGPFTLVDASATCDEAGRAVAVALVNRDRDRDLPVTLDLGAVISGAVSAWEVNGADVTATNSFETPSAVDVRERKLDARGARLEIMAPAHSVTMLRLGV